MKWCPGILLCCFLDFDCKCLRCRFQRCESVLSWSREFVVNQINKIPALNSIKSYLSSFTIILPFTCELDAFESLQYLWNTFRRMCQHRFKWSTRRHLAFVQQFIDSMFKQYFANSIVVRALTKEKNDSFFSFCQSNSNSNCILPVSCFDS